MPALADCVSHVLCPRYERAIDCLSHGIPDDDRVLSLASK